MHKFHSRPQKRTFIYLIVTLSLFLVWLAACSTAPEVVEVTRVVTETETVEVEAEPVEVIVTRVVTETEIITETITETVEVEEEIIESETSDDTLEEEPEPPLATGSEDDSGPLPPEPEDGPKVVSRDEPNATEPTASSDNLLETAVPRRANAIQNVQLDDPILITIAHTENSNEWSKLCELATETYKKHCN